MRTIEGMAVVKAELALGAAPGAIAELLDGPVPLSQNSN